MKARKIDTYKDKYYGAETNVYKYPNDFRVVETIRSDLKGVDATVTFGGGSYLDGMLGIPYGTAHMFEHLSLQPNSHLPSRLKIDSFILGNTKRPAVYLNGSTSQNYTMFYGDVHYSGILRLVKGLLYICDYSAKMFSSFLENEREVIVSEIASSTSKTMRYIKNTEFLVGKYYFPEGYVSGLGTVDSVKQITIDDIITYGSAISDPRNFVFCVQSPKAISKRVWECIDDMSKLYRSHKLIKLPKPKIYNEFGICHYGEDVKDEDVSVEISLFERPGKKLNYKRDVLDFLIAQLFAELQRLYVREDGGYIYWWRVLKSWLFTDLRSNSVSFSTRPDVLGKVLDIIFEMLTLGIDKFLDSRYGRDWFESQLSYFIYPLNPDHNPEYATMLGIGILNGVAYKYDMDKKIKAARSTTISELKKFAKLHFWETPCKIWLASSFDEKRILKIVKQTKLYKHMSALKPLEV